MRSGAHEAAVELAAADEPVEHLAANLADVDHVRALRKHADQVALRQLRGLQPHVMPKADPKVLSVAPGQVAEHADKRPPDLFSEVAVDLLAVQTADVVGLENLLRNVHGVTE
uniref:Unannotated protein n=1 Tax=freshwater metagenome TaxID=449393 RepID=A0A6J6A357_9ZZZZ